MSIMDIICRRLQGEPLSFEEREELSSFLRHEAAAAVSYHGTSYSNLTQSDLEDCSSDTCLKFLAATNPHCPRYSPEFGTTPKTFLWAIAKYVVHDQSRANARRSHHEVHFADLQLTTDQNSIDQPVISIEEIAGDYSLEEDYTATSVVKLFLSTLPRHLRKVAVYLHKGLDKAQIAERERVSLRTVQRMVVELCGKWTEFQAAF